MSVVFNFNVPKNKDGAIIYQCRTYHLLSIFADVYEYETDKKIKDDFLEHINGNYRRLKIRSDACFVLKGVLIKKK